MHAIEMDAGQDLVDPASHAFNARAECNRRNHAARP